MAGVWWFLSSLVACRTEWVDLEVSGLTYCGVARNGEAKCWGRARHSLSDCCRSS